jgi:transcriptional antiterminator NusG
MNLSTEIKNNKDKTIDSLNWYSIRVMSGKEKLVEENIFYEAKINNIENFIEEVFLPYDKVVELKNNKKTIKEKMFFPGYILIKMLLNKKTKYIIENINGVMSFVGPKGKPPVPLRNDEIKRIFGEVERKEGREVLVTPFKKGDFVKVIAGPTGGAGFALPAGICSFINPITFFAIFIFPLPLESNQVQLGLIFQILK